MLVCEGTLFEQNKNGRHALDPFLLNVDNFCVYLYIFYVYSDRVSVAYDRRSLSGV
jgi:hypothetical protein